MKISRFWGGSKGSNLKGRGGSSGVGVESKRQGNDNDYEYANICCSCRLCNPHHTQLTITLVPRALRTRQYYFVELQDL